MGRESERQDAAAPNPDAPLATLDSGQIETLRRVGREWGRVCGDPSMWRRTVFVRRARVNDIESLRRLRPDLTLTVILPEIIVRHWWQRALHNRTAPRLRRALRPLRKVVVTTVPFHLPG